LKNSALNALCVTVFCLGLFAVAGVDACKDNYTTCTEGGCGTMLVAVNCDMWCAVGNSHVQIKCKTPGQIDENSEPTTGSP